MKKLLLLSAILGSITILPAVSNAATSSNVSGQQVVYRTINQPRFRRGTRTVITTRVVFRYGMRYRETVRVTYRGNRIVRTVVVRRVRLGGRVFRNY
jgi:hypothetical protein